MNNIIAPYLKKDGLTEAEKFFTAFYLGIAGGNAWRSSSGNGGVSEASVLRALEVGDVESNELGDDGFLLLFLGQRPFPTGVGLLTFGYQHNTPAANLDIPSENPIIVLTDGNGTPFGAHHLNGSNTTGVSLIDTAIIVPTDSDPDANYVAPVDIETFYKMAESVTTGGGAGDSNYSFGFRCAGGRLYGKPGCIFDATDNKWYRGKGSLLNIPNGAIREYTPTTV
jgi:hypothetical protein